MATIVRRTFPLATHIVGEFDRQFGIKYFATLLRLREDHNPNAALDEYQVLLLDLWLFVRCFPSSTTDLQKMNEYAIEWCKGRYGKN